MCALLLSGGMDVEKVDIKQTISLSDAAKALGLKSFRNVKHLIKKGLLKAYKPKFSRNTRVLITEVEELAKMEEV